mmetsp:Transcript_37445/g.118077  ORF Transcript_37445/g.118077 Transcript_37445/m.118077 type:complete len:141 (-) Transcript_37445:1237-1659(-)
MIQVQAMVQNLHLPRCSSQEALQDLLAVSHPPWLSSHCSLKPSRSLPALADLSLSSSDDLDPSNPSLAPPVWPAHSVPRLLGGIRPAAARHPIMPVKKSERRLLQSSLEEEGSWTLVKVPDMNQDVRRVYNAYMSRAIEQ